MDITCKSKGELYIYIYIYIYIYFLWWVLERAIGFQKKNRGRRSRKIIKKLRSLMRVGTRSVYNWFGSFYRSQKRKKKLQTSFSAFFRRPPPAQHSILCLLAVSNSVLAGFHIIGGNVSLVSRIEESFVPIIFLKIRLKDCWNAVTSSANALNGNVILEILIALSGGKQLICRVVELIESIWPILEP